MASTAEPSTTPPPRGLEYVRLDEVLLADRNPQGHDEDGIARAIAHHGFGEVPLRDDRSGKLVAGHGRHEQLVAMHARGDGAPDGIMVDEDGMWLMPVITGWRSRSDLDAEAYLMGSNQLTKKGGQDDYLAAEILADLSAANLLELTGYDQGDFDAMQALFATGDHDDDLLDDDFDQMEGELGEGKASDLWPALRLVLPPILHESWKAHLDTQSGDEVQAFAVLLGVDPAELPDPE